MYSQTPSGKASKGSVQVITSHDRLQLRFRYAGKRHYLSLGFSDTPENRKLAEMKARAIELNILSGHFDISLAKYQPPMSLSTESPDIKPKITPRLPDLWQKYTDARKTRR